MSHSKKNIPKRRFKKFSNIESWEQLELGEVIEDQYNGQTPSRANDAFWKGNINWLSSGELNKGIVTKTMEKITEAGQDNARLKIIPKGTFVLAITGLEAAGTRGNCGILGIDTALNQSCMALFPNKKKLAAPFLFQWYLKIGEEYGIRYTQGTKQQSYNAALIKILPIALPSMGEQVVIAEFLDRLDNTIALHQRKLEKIKALKTAYLSEMFPAEGETKPKRRFAGFTDDWEQRKLGEIANSFEYGLNASSKTYDGENKYIRITDIDESSHVFNQDNLTSPNISLDKLNHYLLEEGDILLARTGASTGKSYYYSKMDGKVFFAGFLIRAKIKQEYNVSFIFQNTLTERYNNFIQVTSQRSGQPGINAQEYARFALYIPELKEQQKIGVFFKQLDNAIALHQRKLQKLQNIKKAYLNEMFI
ncbi:restriction endonuclease subunit S [Listeria monocytogenes]|uniref:restriction endonuclease subunit S n=1 Tax=Listeria monocytogenes TaxID=1639 RepID=UPI0010D79DFA|nr:restriction endonuclease subunit S [Listeria monocytogenes]EHC5288602.1 restriction endonuclease subunit S [Listeria monocytogenes serotype 1/2a]EAD0095996.1 restriction endonuclease subunit S [Listeria monocytogenes]ECL0113032.1 restriction endonuclease subunit S [Listeria monocytogenes]EHC6208683.1 restriction endonuclease subunit S [Listeria monocytogenes serotype 1/2a]EHC6345808.1 restriction endonuclease subunit S [Listeria monocytogenes serotype 1/2a]